MRKEFVLELLTLSSPQYHYRATYYEAIDTVIGCITDRIEQQGYQRYYKVEQLLATKERNDEVYEILKFYSSVVQKDTLLTQLHVFHTNYPTEKS